MPLQRGGQRWEVMWTAEIIADRKTSSLPGREEESDQRGEAASGCKYRIGIWLAWLYVNFELLHLKRKKETNKSILRIAKQTEKVFRLPQGCLFFAFCTSVHRCSK